MKSYAVESGLAKSFGAEKSAMENVKQIIVIGGGAAGLAAAIAAAWKARNEGTHVHVRIFESDDRVGRSILVTGNGRCNFTNAQIDVEKYNNGAFVGEALSALEEVSPWQLGAGEVGEDAGVGAVANADVDAGVGSGEVGEDAGIDAAAKNSVQAFFQTVGMAWRQEGEGRMYPATGKASTVLNLLRRAARELGVEECCEHEVLTLEPPRESGGVFTLRMKDGSFERAHKVILACGGNVISNMLPEGLEFTQQRQALGPLATNTEHIRALDNIRVRCNVALERDGKIVASEHGELLFRKYGVSGIAVFNLSRLAHSGDMLVVDFLPNCNDAFALLESRANKLNELFQREPNAEELLDGLVLPLVAEAIIKRADGTSLDTLSKFLKRFTLQVQDIGDAKQCQVHQGGIKCEELNSHTMETHKYPGLFIAGEALDVDGPCGGYNLHWAWASGLLAGINV